MNVVLGQLLPLLRHFLHKNGLVLICRAETQSGPIKANKIDINKQKIKGGGQRRESVGGSPDEG